MGNRRGDRGLGERAGRGLTIRDTADCQSAARGRSGDAVTEREVVMADVREIVALIGREEGAEK